MIRFFGRKRPPPLKNILKADDLLHIQRRYLIRYINAAVFEKIGFGKGMAASDKSRLFRSPCNSLFVVWMYIRLRSIFYKNMPDVYRWFLHQYVSVLQILRCDPTKFLLSYWMLPIDR